MVYQSNETGSFEVYVQTVPPSGNRWKISSGGGTLPRWRADGNELFYYQPAMGLMAVEVKNRKSPNQFDFGQPELIARSLVNSYDVTSDGQRFIIHGQQQNSISSAAKLTVVINWMSGLLQRKNINQGLRP